MSKQLTKLVNAIVNNTSRNLKRKNRKNKRKQGKNMGIITRAMPSAYAAHIRPRFNILSRSDRHCVVSGCDLIYKIPATLFSNGDALFSVIPANPAYWIGTRIGRIAPAYQAYRPIYFKVSYIPQVAVTQQGTVFMGTLWDMAPPQTNLQQSLLTSNGGQLTQCYIPSDSTVSLGRNLQQNLFKMTGALNTDTNPFLFCVGVAGAQVIPGYLYVSYKYELRNPIGDSWTFINSGLTTVSALPIQDNTANGTVILMNQVATLGPGTILDRESGATQFYYHGSQIDLPEQTNILYLNNFQTNVNTAARNFSLPEDDVFTYLTKFGVPSNPRSFSEMKPIIGETEVGMGFVVQLNKGLNQYSLLLFTPGSSTAKVKITPTSGFDYWYYSTTGTTVSLYTENGQYMTIPRVSVTAGENIYPSQDGIVLSRLVKIENLPI